MHIIISLENSKKYTFCIKSLKETSNLRFYFYADSLSASLKENAVEVKLDKLNSVISFIPDETTTYHLRVYNRSDDTISINDLDIFVYNVEGEYTFSDFFVDVISEDTFIAENYLPVVFYNKSRGLPALYLTGDTTSMTKKVAVTLDYKFNNLEGTCTCKWQGSSSQAYPKKNFKIKLSQAAILNSNWGD